jgi:TRAP-type mannitol/chloroaromatic compound transport system permease large subunit
MAIWIAQNMAPIMFASLVVFLLLGYPVAFSLGACGLFFFIVGVELAPLSGGAISLSWPLLQSLPERVFGVMANDTLLAIPFFTLMGLILERSGMAEDLLDTIGQLFGTVRGGLAYAVIFVGALLAATTGVVAASVISMGLISLPIMLRYGYDRRVAAGVIAASGTLAQIIPPSLVLIVMADQLGKSVGDMYEGAFIPGIVLAALYAAYIFIVATFFPAAAPGLPKDSVGFKEDLGSFTHGFLARMSGLLILAMAGYFLYSSIGTIKSLATSPDLTDKIWPVIVIAAIGYLAQLSIRFVISGQDERGLSSLLALTLVAAAVGYGLMEAINAKAVAAGKSVYKGADFVVLCMAIGIVIAFSAAVVNWVLDKITGLRFLSRLAQQVTFVMVPPLFLIFLVLGTIFIGVATPTEGGAMGAMGAILLALFKRWLDGNPKRFNFALLRSAVEATAKLSAFVVFILVGARIFSLTFYGVNGHLWVEHLLTSLPGGQTGFLIFVNIMVFLLAFFLDFFELAFIIIPLLGPAAEKLGIDLIWFGVMLGVNMQTSFMHPPFGFALFYLRSVAAKEPYKDKLTGIMTEPVTTGQIYWGAVPFVVIQCIMVGLVIFFPRMVMHYKSSTPDVDPSKVEIVVPTYGGGIGVPNFGVPGMPAIPGLPPIGGPVSAPSIPGLPPPPTIPALPPALTAPEAPKQ